MSLHDCRIEVYEKLSDNTYSNTVDYTVVPLNFGLNWSLEQKADSFNIAIPLLSVSDFSKYKVNSKIKVYGIINGVESLLVDGVIQKVKASTKPSGQTIILSCLNRLEKMFNALVATTGETVPHSAKYWLQTVILAQVNDFNKNLTIGWAAINDTYPEGHLIPFTRGHTPALQLMEELSQPEFTGGENYIFYLTNDNELVWRPRDDSSVVQSEIIYSTQNFEQTADRAMWEIVNYIILNCGKSLYETASILQLGYNQTSIADYGWKMKVILANDIGDKRKEKEIASQIDQNVRQNDSLFPSSYPYRTSWGEEIEDTGLSALNDFNYNKAFVKQVRSEGSEKISQLLEKGSSPTYKLRAEIKPNFDYVLGANYIVENAVLNWIGNNRPTLRLQAINYTFNKQGWKVDLSMKEDEQEIILY